MPPLVQVVDQVQRVADGAAEPVESMHHDDIALAGVSQQYLQPGPLGGGPGLLVQPRLPRNDAGADPGEADSGNAGGGAEQWTDHAAAVLTRNGFYILAAVGGLPLIGILFGLLGTIAAVIIGGGGGGINSSPAGRASTTNWPAARASSRADGFHLRHLRVNAPVTRT